MFRTWARRLSKATLDNENCIVSLNSEPMAACKRQVKTPVKFFFVFFFQWFYLPPAGCCGFMSFPTLGQWASRPRGRSKPSSN